MAGRFLSVKPKSELHAADLVVAAVVVSDQAGVEVVTTDLRPTLAVAVVVRAAPAAIVAGAETARAQSAVDLAVVAEAAVAVAATTVTAPAAAAGRTYLSH